jgi:cell division protein FtsB
MMKQEEGEAPFAQELLEVSNRRAAALKAIVETQRLEIADLLNEKNGIEKEIADLSNEKDGIEKECKYKVDKLTRKLLKQQAELQLLKDSSSDVEVGRMKRKHTNEEHEEGEGTPVVQSQSQSSKRSRSENAANISSVSLDINLAEDEDAAVIAGYNMLMSQHMATRRELRIAKARNVELKQEIDDLAI